MSEGIKCAYIECDNFVERSGAVIVYLDGREYIFCSPGCRDLEAAILGLSGLHFSPIRPDKKSKEYRVYERERRV